MKATNKQRQINPKFPFLLAFLLILRLSVLIFDLLEAKEQNNAIVEGSRKVVGVMEKDAKKFSETGGWGFEGFKGDTKERAVTDPKNACFNCHEAQKNTDYVFSTYRK